MVLGIITINKSKKKYTNLRLKILSTHLSSPREILGVLTTFSKACNAEHGVIGISLPGKS